MPDCPNCGAYARIDDTMCPKCGYRADFAALAAKDHEQRHVAEEVEEFLAERKREAEMPPVVPQQSKAVRVSTLTFMPGEQVVEYRGLISAQAVAQPEASGVLDTDRAWSQVIDSLRAKAETLGCDAVLGLHVTMTAADSAGSQSVVVLAVGTGVALAAN